MRSCSLPHGGIRNLCHLAVAICLSYAGPQWLAGDGVTFVVTSDSHYDAFENEDRNERNVATVEHINQITSVRWPDELGGDPIDRPRGVLLLGDVIDDGDRMRIGQSQSEQQCQYFLADFGLDGSDGRLRYPMLGGVGNHDGPPGGREKHGFSFQARLKERSAQRRASGLIDHVSSDGLNYSWEWDGVRLVQLNLCPADRPHPEVHYSPEYHDLQNSLAFLKEDLAAHVGQSGAPVVLTHHYDLQGSDWWHEDQRRAYYEAIQPYNVIAVFYGHTGTGFYTWKPADADGDPLHVINTGQTENGFFVVQITDEQIRLAYRCQIGVTETRGADGQRRREWSGDWGWRHTQGRESAQ